MRVYKTLLKFHQATPNLEEYLPLVKKISGSMLKHLPSSIELSDLIQTGVLGLMDAFKNYNFEQKNTFEAYAAQRIRGAIVDELRRADFLPKDVRKQLKIIQNQIHLSEQQLGRMPTESEIAEALGWTLQEYQHILGQAKGLRLIHLEDMSHEEQQHIESIEDHHALNPSDFFDELEFRTYLTQSIKTLPERDQLLMQLYYDEELNLKEIAAILGISESRVSQLHTQIILHLRQSIQHKGWEHA